MDFIGVFLWALNYVVYLFPILPIVALFNMHRSRRELEKLERTPHAISNEQLDALEQKLTKEKH